MGRPDFVSENLTGVGSNEPALLIGVLPTILRQEGWIHRDPGKNP